jgi:hypothetical protein
MGTTKYDESFFQKGIMKKDPFDMTDQERKVWQKEAADRARIYLFSIGQPLVYEKDGQMIAEYADGSIKKI